MVQSFIWKEVKKNEQKERYYLNKSSDRLIYLKLLMNEMTHCAQSQSELNESKHLLMSCKSMPCWMCAQYRKPWHKKIVPNSQHDKWSWRLYQRDFVCNETKVQIMKSIVLTSCRIVVILILMLIGSACIFWSF